MTQRGHTTSQATEPYWASYAIELGSRVKMIREMQGVSQKKLAERAGISRTLISNLERNIYNRNKAADPTLSTIYRLAAALQVPPAQLLPSGEALVAERNNAYRFV